MQGLRRASPDVFEPKRQSLKEHTLELSTADQDRVTRAWQYIYSHAWRARKAHFLGVGYLP
jgi:hypothetical protein